MFHHQGKSRTAKHNLHLASFLSFVAGMVNITGYLGITQLTTNVTGHFAHFIAEVARFNLLEGANYLLYIFCFLAGSFISNTLIEREVRAKRINKFAAPVLLESLLLIVTSLLIHFGILKSPHAIACFLLTAMGIQNSFVTKVSDTVVRTTHLSGLFTDLGIELSQLCFDQPPELRKKLLSTVQLRLSIVGFFFLGGVFAFSLFKPLGFDALFVAVIVLLAALIHDGAQFDFIRKARR